MAGSQNVDDNPVAINVTAMVDIIFCLCLFFMCSLHFKQLEGKIDSWLPPKGNKGPIHDVLRVEEIRVLMRTDPAGGRVVRRIGSREPARSDDELMGIVRLMAADYARAGKTLVPVIIDATPEVPWREVVHFMDLCRLDHLDHIELAQPAPVSQDLRESR